MERPRTINRTLAAIAGMLFIGAGALSILAAQIRWGGACADFDTEQCVIVQDHLY